MTVGSLFSGIGGIELGLERTGGFKTVWQVEKDDYARKVLAKHWPDVRRHDDVVTFPYRWNARADVICGGPPCERTSTAAAIQGVRTGETLWPEMHRIARIINPSWVIVEQPGGNQAWEATVKSDLEGIGYHVARLQFTACSFGAPHQRRRVFFVANPVRERCEAVARLAGSPETPGQAWPAPPRGTWREAGAGNRRVDDGFSDWMDRLRTLGKAVVPQVAEWIGRRILEAAA